MAKRGRTVRGRVDHRIVEDPIADNREHVVSNRGDVSNRSAIPAARMPPIPGDTSDMSEDDWWLAEAQRIHDEDQIALGTGLIPGMVEEPLMPQELNPDGSLADPGDGDEDDEDEFLD